MKIDKKNATPQAKNHQSTRINL